MGTHVQREGQDQQFLRELDNLPDTGTLRSTCYELYYENANNSKKF